MEKFGAWKDPGTGIMPFVPPKSQRKNDAPSKIGYFLKDFFVGPLISILRLLLISIVSLWMVFVTFLQNMIPISVVKRGFKRYTYSMGARFILALMGFWWINSSKKSLKKGRRDESNNSKVSRLKAGDIIISNHISYIEILYLAFRFSPQFVTIHTRGDKTLVKAATLFEIFSSSISEPKIETESEEKLESLEDFCKKCPEPIAIFPEAVTSNGNSVLKFMPVFQNFNFKNKKIQLIAFRFNFQDFSPSFPVGSFYVHLFYLCCQFYNSLEVIYLPQEENFEDIDKINDPNEAVEQITTNLANLLRVRKAQLSAKDKTGFLNYYNITKNTKSGYKQKGE